MAEYLTNTTDLTSVADAIRAKSGQTGQLIYPDGFASAVAGIKKAPTTPYMEAEYIVEEDTEGNTNHYIDRAKLYNHKAIYAYEFAFQHRLNSLDFSDASNNITAIETSAFQGSNMDGLVLPSTISVLNRVCFNGAYISTLVVPPLVTVLPESAFSYIQPVFNYETGEVLPINIILPQNLTKIGTYCFDGAPIEQITIPDTVTEIGEGAFNYCYQLASVILPSSLQKISDHMLINCQSLTSLTIPAAVTAIGVEAFTRSGLTTITIPSTVTTLGPGAFSYCESLTSMDIQAAVTAIPNEFAIECPLTSLTLPNTLQTIGTAAFFRDKGFQVTELTIPASVTSIGDYAFSGNVTKQMTLTVLPTTPPTLGSNVFFLDTMSVIKVPAASVAAYKSATNWSSYADYIVGV